MSDDLRATFGVRARILATVLALAAIGMALAGSAFVFFERRQGIAHVDNVLTGAAGQLRDLGEYVSSEGTIDGKPITVTNMLEEAMQRHITTDHEDVFGVINGRVALETRQPTPGIHEDPAMRLAVADLPNTRAAGSVQLRQLNSPQRGLIRYVAVPVSIEGQPEIGYFVVAIEMDPVLAQLMKSAWVYSALSLGALAVVCLGGWLVAGRLLRPITLISDAAQRISHTDLSARIPVRGNDDVSALTRTVNSMLDRLQGAFSAQQAFLDDAGHELRTPLTIVRGHLELVDEESPDDVRSTHALVIDELDRMARMVNDLIVLAQSGRPDFVRLRAVDLDDLLHAVHDKVPALAERTWLLEATPGVIVQADAHRITQALLQLTDNAVRFTGPGDVIAIGASRGVENIDIWVRDTGPGVPPAERQRIFQRFGRAEQPPTPQDHRSSGLGLSIVAGIAAAHGGEVLLDEKYSGGARFVLRLPLRVLGVHPPVLVQPPGVSVRPTAGALRESTTSFEGLDQLFQQYAPVTHSPEDGQFERGNS